MGSENRNILGGIWSIKVVEEDYEVSIMLNNTTMAQIKSHKKRKTRKSKAKACHFATVSTTILTRIMSLRTKKKRLRLFEGTIWKRWKNIRHMSVEFNKGIWVTKDGVWDNKRILKQITWHSQQGKVACHQIY